MNILELDEYSLQQIFIYLDLESLKNITKTCRKLKELSLRTFNLHSTETTLNNKLIYLLQSLHSKARNIFYGDKVFFALQFILQTLDCCLNDSLEIERANSSLDKEMERVQTVQKLLSKVCKDADCSDSVSLEHIIHIHHLSFLSIYHWYTFRISQHKFIYLCSTRERKEQNFNPILDAETYAISIHYNASLKKAKIFSCGLRVHEYGDEES